jgi:hypothetical protein
VPTDTSTETSATIMPSTLSDGIDIHEVDAHAPLKTGAGVVDPRESFLMVQRETLLKLEGNPSSKAPPPSPLSMPAIENLRHMLQHNQSKSDTTPAVTNKNTTAPITNTVRKTTCNDVANAHAAKLASNINSTNTGQGKSDISSSLFDAYPTPIIHTGFLTLQKRRFGRESKRCVVLCRPKSISDFIPLHSILRDMNITLNSGSLSMNRSNEAVDLELWGHLAYASGFSKCLFMALIFVL